MLKKSIFGQLSTANCANSMKICLKSGFSVPGLGTTYNFQSRPGFPKEEDWDSGILYRD